MTRRMKQIAAFGASLALCAVISTPVFAQSKKLTANDLGVNTLDDSLALGGGDVRTTIANIINVSLGFLGIIATVIILVGGFKYMISGGSEEKTNEAKQLIISGIIGLAIILSAWAITRFVISRLITATSDEV